MCICTRVGGYMYTHVEARSGCQGSSFITPHLVFEAGSHTEPENEPGVCWASEPMRSTCLHTPHPSHPHRSPVLESQTHVTMSGFSGWGWDLNSGPLLLMLSQQAFFPRIHLLGAIVSCFQCKLFVHSTALICGLFCSALPWALRYRDWT